MKKRFITLIDFSPHSEWLLGFIHEWAKQVNADLLAVHHPMEFSPGMGDRELLVEIKQNSIEKSLEKLKSFSYDVLGPWADIDFYVDNYNLASTIEKLERKDILDYIFLGMKDKPGIEKYIVGSTALDLANQLKNIIVAFPTAVQDFNANNLCIGVKQGVSLNDDAFLNLLSAYKGRATSAHFFSVVKDENLREKAMLHLAELSDKYAGEINTSFEVLVNENSIATIKNYMLDNKGMLVIQKGSRSLIDMFRKFFTTEMVHLAQIPVVILP